jgi:thioredoxin 1
MEPVLEDLRAEYAGVLRVEFIDVQVDPQTAAKLGVRGIPTQIFYDASGKERYRHMGYMSKENILAAFKELGVELARKDGGKKGK